MLATSIVLAALIARGPTPVVVSTDIGCEMDDQWAVAHLALSPSIQLRAVVTAHAPGLDSEATATAARDVVDRLPAGRKPPVVAGSGRPLKDRSTPNRNAGIDRLLAESRDFNADRRLSVVVIGPATDVASALVIDPGFAHRVSVVAMGFDGWPRGGDPFNVRNDPAAWQVLIDSPTPIVVADAEVTRRHLTLDRTRSRSRFACVSPLADHLVALQSSWLAREPQLARRITGSADAWPVWDEGTTAVLLGFATVETRPRPRLRDDLTFDHDRPRGSIGWVTAIDERRLWADLAGRLRVEP